MAEDQLLCQHSTRLRGEESDGLSLSQVPKATTSRRGNQRPKPTNDQANQTNMEQSQQSRRSVDPPESIDHQTMITAQPIPADITFTNDTTVKFRQQQYTEKTPRTTNADRNGNNNTNQSSIDPPDTRQHHDFNNSSHLLSYSNQTYGNLGQPSIHSIASQSTISSPPPPMAPSYSNINDDQTTPTKVDLL